MASESTAQPRLREYEPPRAVGIDEYLRLSAQLSGAFEYHRGLMYPRFYPPGSHAAMAGGTRAHARLIVRLLAALEAHLDGTPCAVYPSDMRLYVAEHTYFFPDAFVVCDESDAPGSVDQRDALLIVEVRSASTSDFDRGEKFEAYQTLPGLREYLLLDNRRPRATLYRLVADGTWRYVAFTDGSDLILESVGLQLSLERLYSGVPLDRDEGEHRPS